MVDIQSATAEIRRGKNKLQNKHIMSASATHGGNNNSSVMNAYIGGYSLITTVCLLTKYHWKYSSWNSHTGKVEAGN